MAGGVCAAVLGPGARCPKHVPGEHAGSHVRPDPKANVQTEVDDRRDIGVARVGGHGRGDCQKIAGTQKPKKDGQVDASHRKARDTMKARPLRGSTPRKWTFIFVS